MKSVFFVVLLALVGCTQTQQLAWQDPVVGKYDRFRDFTRYSTKLMYCYIKEDKGCMLMFGYLCDGRGDCLSDTLFMAVLDMGVGRFSGAENLYLLVDGARATVPVDTDWPFNAWRGPYIYGIIARAYAEKMAVAELVEGQINGYEWRAWNDNLQPLRDLLAPKTFELK